MTRILDGLDAIEAAVPQLRGRLDRGKVAVAGHAMGGHTASLLLGARLTDPDDGTEVNLTESVARNYPFFSTIDFAKMTTPTLVVAGDQDTCAHLTVRGADWHTDPYFLAPGPKSLLTLFDAEHGLSGISGYDVAETTDENPERVAVVQRLTSAYLRTAFHPGDSAWRTACDALMTGTDPLGRVESK